MKKMYKTQKGITLVALVITIIVLIILAAVSINAVMNDGLIENARTAAGEYKEEKAKETISLAYLTALTKNRGNADATNFATDFIAELAESGITDVTANGDGTFTVVVDGVTYDVSSKGKVEVAVIWTKAADGTITNNINDTTFTVGDKVTLTAEGVPTTNWFVYGVRNNKLELISATSANVTVKFEDYFTETDSYTYDTLISQETFSRIVSERLRVSFGFTSTNNILRAPESGEEFDAILNFLPSSWWVASMSVDIFEDSYLLSIYCAAGYGSYVSGEDFLTPGSSWTHDFSPIISLCSSDSLTVTAVAE